MEIVETPWQKFGDPARKRKFAALCRERPDNDNARFEAACLVFPEHADTQLAMRAMREWPTDPFVIEAMAALAKAEEAEALPSREQQARDVYRLASDSTKSVDDRIKAHKLYAEIVGNIQKPSAVNAPTYIDNRRVMLMPQPANSMDEWEAAATTHQAKLMADAGN